MRIVGAGVLIPAARSLEQNDLHDHVLGARQIPATGGGACSFLSGQLVQQKPQPRLQFNANVPSRSFHLGENLSNISQHDASASYATASERNRESTRLHGCFDV